MTADLYTALAKANETLRNPGKDGKGVYGTYLTLDALLEAVRGPLAAQGLSIVQDVTDDDERVYVTTRLVHASGDQLTFGPMSSPRGQNIQHAGAAVTYLRRFTLGAAIGVAGEADDDGQSHTDEVTVTPNPKNLKGPALRDVSGACTPKQVGMIRRLMTAQGLNEVALDTLTNAELGFGMPRDGIDHLTKGQASALIDRMMQPDTATPVQRGVADDDPWAGPPPVDPLTGETAVL